RLCELARSDAFDNDPKRVAKLLADLDSDEPETREKATKCLRTLAKVVEPALREALANKLSAEVAQRVDGLLQDIARAVEPPQVLRIGRAIEVLEWIGSAKSREALEGIGKAANGPWLRDAATA